jgi:hypothetical protein
VIQIPVVILCGHTYGKMRVGLCCQIGMSTGLIGSLDRHVWQRFDTLEKVIDAALHWVISKALAK